MQAQRCLFRSAVLLGWIFASGPVAHAAEVVANTPDAMPPAAVDNSAINRRDRMSQTLTPLNQSGTPEDIELVAALRRSVMETPGISVDGQNIKIIAHVRLVTLRGPVRDYEERMTIERAIRRVVGEGAIDNQLQAQ